MAYENSIPDSAIPSSVEFIQIPLKAGTGTGDNRKEIEFNQDVPKNLAHACKLEGEKAVFMRYMKSLVIDKQGEKRREMETKAEGETGARADWVGKLGL